jgi:hypothetical protein
MASDYHFGIYKPVLGELIKKKDTCRKTTKYPVDGRRKNNIKTIFFRSEISLPA